MLFQVVAFAIIARLISTSPMGLLDILSLILGLARLIAPFALPVWFRNRCMFKTTRVAESTWQTPPLGWNVP